MSGKYVFKFSLPNKSVYSTTIEDFAFHSEYGSVKVATEPPNNTVVPVTVAGSSTTTLIVGHGLSSAPLAMVYAEKTPGSGRYYFGCVFPGFEDRSNEVDIVGQSANTYTDDTNLVIKFLNSSVSSQTVNVYYFILGDSSSWVANIF